MKAKPILIIFGILVLVTVVALIVRGHIMAKPQKTEIAQFIKKFEANLEAGNTDSLNSYLESNQHGKIITKLFNILSNKTAADGKSDPLFKMALNVDKAQITVLNNELVQVTIPVTFAHDKISSEQTFLVLKIHQLDPHHYRIVQVDARRLLADLVVYEKKIKKIGMSDKDLYSDITLASFKTAKSLVPKYDSVIWFQHIGGKTWYYVVKGKYQQYNYNDSVKQANPYKIGLVNPDLKEIIPPKYDLVHNINGTIDGLIEVEDGDKKGFFDTNGKNVVPVTYDQAFALTDSTNLALLVKDDDYFYLKKDLTISDKLSGLKISDEIKKVKNFGNSFTLEDKDSDDLMEYNDREDYNSLIISPSYMVELGILPKFIDLPNHLRKVILNPEEEDGDGEGSEYYKVTFNGHKADDNNWFESAYYSIVDNYLGGRAGLYQSKDMLVIDKKKNKILTYNPEAYIPNRDGGGELTGLCNDNALRQLNDTLFELKTTAIIGQLLNGVQIDEFPHYSYLHLVKGKLTALPTIRYFGFTEFVKMDDSYLEGCYVVNGKRTDHLSPEVLQYMKNEIFASYGLRFKTEKWAKEFEYAFGYDDKTRHDNVNDSLTVIDKYNINWLSQKLNGVQSNTQLAK